MLYLLYLPVLFLITLIYFKLAVLYNVIDKPNHRSSHSELTIRGGGIIFPISLLLNFLINGLDYPLFTLGLILISLVSFYDDLRPLSNKIRLIVHLIGVSLLFMQTGLMDQALWIVGVGYVVVIGTINAYNFMDGINGITGSYSLLTLLSLYAVNETNNFVITGWLSAAILALVVFNFFNFRKKAKCFAGDVGSVSIAFIIIFFVLLLILKTGDLKYIGFLLVYGLDSVTTIIFRLIRGENIFEAHRSHLYQYLANARSWPHLWVSGLYMLVQLLLNVFIIIADLNSLQLSFLILLSGLVFVRIRVTVEGRSYLLERLK